MRSQRYRAPHAANFSTWCPVRPIDTNSLSFSQSAGIGMIVQSRVIYRGDAAHVCNFCRGGAAIAGGLLLQYFSRLADGRNRRAVGFVWAEVLFAVGGWQGSEAKSWRYIWLDRKGSAPPAAVTFYGNTMLYIRHEFKMK
jgi:hypothetical protein